MAKSSRPDAAIGMPPTLNAHTSHRWTSIYTLRPDVTVSDIENAIDECILQVEGMACLLGIEAAATANDDLKINAMWALQLKASELRALRDAADDMRSAQRDSGR